MLLVAIIVIKNIVDGCNMQLINELEVNRCAVDTYNGMNSLCD